MTQTKLASTLVVFYEQKINKFGLISSQMVRIKVTQESDLDIRVGADAREGAHGARARRHRHVAL